MQINSRSARSNPFRLCLKAQHGFSSLDLLAALTIAGIGVVAFGSLAAATGHTVNRLRTPMDLDPHFSINCVVESETTTAEKDPKLHRLLCTASGDSKPTLVIGR